MIIGEKAPTWLPQNELDRFGAAEKRRLKKLYQFIDDLHEPCADCGESNPIKKALEKYFNVKITSLDIDLDREKINGKFGTILCFEVLEHLFNPLYCLETIKNSLTDNGVLYLSTPYRMKLLWGHRHFHEIDNKRIKWLFQSAGFRIVKQVSVSIRWEWWRHFTGFRPLLRLFQKTRLYKLTKVLDN